MRVPPGPGWLVVLACALACTPGPRPSDAEIYTKVVEAVADAVDAPSPVQLHPYLMQRPQGEQTLDQGTYNAFDSTTIADLAQRHDALELCAMNTVGSCVVPDGGVAVVLSEMQELGVNGVGVGTLVMDGRPGWTPQRYATVRVKPTGRGWEVVAVDWRGP